ncbi:MAG: flagellar basal body L-ring protein FlgH [Spirochaetaceae bacterium]|nr:MAG: flagellar basal body L-ring protein FlgH [Spirochaetaceae bacterium]
MKILKISFLFGCTILSLIIPVNVIADSLWSPGFPGYLTSQSAVQEGDIVLVQIDASSSLSFEASATDAKNITFEFSGGEFGNLFSFLPSTRTGGSQSTKGNQDYSLETEVAARITEIDDTGKARLEGIRSFSLENKDELVSISGWIDPGTLGSDRRISFSQLADARLQFRTFLQPAGATLTAADIEEVIELIETAPVARPPEGRTPAATIAPAEAVPGEQPSTAAPVVQERRSYQLSQEKKIELFLSYINRMVDLLFQ